MKRGTRRRGASFCIATFAAACGGEPSRAPTPAAAPEARVDAPRAPAGARTLAAPPLYRGDAIRRDANGQCKKWEYEEPLPGASRNPPAPFALPGCPPELTDVGALRRDRVSGICTLLLTPACAPGAACPPATPTHVACPPGSPDEMRRDEDDGHDEDHGHDEGH